jgi:hypothetical protein
MSISNARMTLDRQLEIFALRNQARIYEDSAATHYDAAIADILRKHAGKLREQADKLEKEGQGP